MYLEHDHLTKTIKTRFVWDQHVKKTKCRVYFDHIKSLQFLANVFSFKETFGISGWTKPPDILDPTDIFPLLERPHSDHHKSSSMSKLLLRLLVLEAPGDKGENRGSAILSGDRVHPSSMRMSPKPTSG